MSKNCYCDRTMEKITSLYYSIVHLMRILPYTVVQGTCKSNSQKDNPALISGNFA